MLSSWKEQELNELCNEITVGYVNTMAKHYEDEGITFLRSQNVKPFRISLDNIRFINDDFHSKLKKSELNPGDVVVVRTGYPGTAAVIPKTIKSANCSDLVIIRVKKNIDPRFIVAFFNSAYGMSLVGGSLVGVAQQHFNVGVAKKVKIHIPCFEEQIKICDALEAYNNLIENNNRRIAILEDMAQSIYQEWFVKFRFPGHQNCKFKESSLGLIPEEWEAVTLGELIDVRKGKNITKKTIVDGDVPVVAGGLTPAYYHNQANTHHPVITVSASGANAGFVNKYEEDIWASDCSYIDNDTSPNVYYYYSLLKDRQIEITRMQRGSAQPHVYPKDLMRLDVLNVTENILNKFDIEISPIFKMMKNVSKINNNLKKQRDLLLPKLISGKVVF